MKRCLITYQVISDDETYSVEGLHLISKQLSRLAPLAYSAEEQRAEAVKRASKMSIQGMQPKLSARLNTKEGNFQIVDTKGIFILKPPHAYYPHLPENEDLTMRLAATVQIEVPLHGLLRAKDDSLTYFVKRFDRFGRGKKRPQEDFAQLTGGTRDTKYDSSVEQVVEIIERYCTFPVIEKLKLFKLVLFSLLIGNEDLHLKNFSLLTHDENIVLSPAYDLVNTTLAMPAATEEMALPLKGKKRNFTHNDVFKYLAKEQLGLTEKALEIEKDLFLRIQEEWIEVIQMSFLPKGQQVQYETIVRERVGRILKTRKGC